MSRGKGIVPKRNKKVCGMMSAVLSDSSSTAPMEKSQSRHHGIRVEGVKEREKREKNALLLFKWLISFLSDTKQNFNDETC